MSVQVISYLKTQGKDNGIFQIELNCQWEVAMANLVNLSCKGGMAGVEVEYMIVKDYCKNTSWTL